MSGKQNNCILDVKDLHVEFRTDFGTVSAVNGVDFQVTQGDSIAIVGESGCGKSVTAYSILRILPKSASISATQINFRKRDGTVRDLAGLPPDGKEIRDIRGAEISMIFQEPLVAFSPVHTVGNQICESMLLHQDMSKDEARWRAIELLGHVGISNPGQRVDEYPFQLSGGMRQRAMIAMALACNPRLLIADEPTTALDVTIQAQVLRLIKRMQSERNLSLILITHDLGIVAQMVDYVYVVYLGYVLEAASVREVFKNPKHPYTMDLLRSIPTLKGVKGRLRTIKGSVPSAYELPDGCPYHPRCERLIGNICRETFPPEMETDPDHLVSCHLYVQE